MVVWQIVFPGLTPLEIILVRDRHHPCSTASREIPDRPLKTAYYQRCESPGARCSEPEVVEH
jgi:hypothetical protein